MMRRKPLLWIFLLLLFPAALARGQALKNPNYANGVQEAGKPVYPYSHGYLVSLNDSIQYPCGFNGTPTEQWGYSFFALATGGDVDATCYQTAFNITADIFSPVAKPILIWLPDVAITVNANATIPSNFMLCYGPGSSIAAGAGYTLTNNAQPCNGSGGGKGQPVNWYVNTTLIGTEPGGDFDNGSGITIGGVDDPTNKQVHITVNGAGCAPGASGLVPDSTFCAGPPVSTSPNSPAVVQYKTKICAPGSSSTQTLAFDLPITTGDTIIVPVTCGALQSGGGCGLFTGFPPTISDSLGNTFTILTDGGNVFPFGYFGAEFGIATVTVPGLDTVTATAANSAQFDTMALYEVKNLGVYEGTAQNSAGGASGYVTTASYTTLHNGDFLLGIGAAQSDAPTALYLNSPDWLAIGETRNYVSSGDYVFYGWSASYQDAAGATQIRCFLPGAGA